MFYHDSGPNLLTRSLTNMAISAIKSIEKIDFGYDYVETLNRTIYNLERQ